ncbi:MAG: TauD/TfdA family dioxygenase [Rhodospirillaceae bacterium]|nr:TauD/TfdA family dioxygenase [Rhodospirillaceae bacterium]MBT5664819.1 TauD/TfdA family dioxygenase [Rhodospirillaceae bacterium]
MTEALRARNSLLQQPVDGAHVWRGPDMATRRDEWLHVMTPGEVADLDAAVDEVEAQGLDILDIARADFPLPVLGDTLAKMRHDLLKGRGFSVLRGVPIDRYDRRAAAVAFWGLGTHLGDDAVSQNGKGHVLGHVKDLGHDYADPMARGYQTSARLPYHTDYSDLVALLCLKSAKSGGLSSIVSSAALYNELCERRPDLAEALTQTFYRTRWGEVGSDKPPYISVPVFNRHNGDDEAAPGVVTTYVRSAIRKAQLLPETPRLTDLQTEAMDAFDALAEDPAFHLDMEFRPGDFQVVNNHWTLHSRTAYEDHADSNDKRHLLRLWLACADGPPFPPAMTKEFEGLTNNGRPNGIHIPGVPFNAPLEAS